MRNNILKCFLALLFVILSLQMNAQEQQVIINEWNMTHGSYIFKLRPMVYYPNNGQYRIDAIIGKSIIKPWKFYLFWKNDNVNAHRFGFRTDLASSFFENKVSASVQYRYFWGLNEKTMNQYYIIPAVSYNFYKFKLGVWMYNVKILGKKMASYSGPTLNYELTKTINLYISYTEDLWSTKTLFYALVWFKINLKKEKTNDVH